MTNYYEEVAVQSIGNRRVGITRLHFARDIEGDSQIKMVSAALLPVGPYAITVASPGKQSVQVSLRVRVGQTDPLRLVMKEGSDTEEKVTVYGAATPLETTVIGENFNYDEEVEMLPIADRDLASVAALAPKRKPSAKPTRRIPGM